MVTALENGEIVKQKPEYEGIDLPARNCWQCENITRDGWCVTCAERVYPRKSEVKR